MSSYLQYLPSVLWAKEGKTLGFIDGFLSVFEKILTGLDDGFLIAHNGHKHTSFEETLNEIHKLFNSFKAQSDDPEWTKLWLEYLASWVALELEPFWDEYQRRKLISEIVFIYRLRGLKQGLHKYFEIYNVSEAKPRVVIDDGDSIFRIVLKDGVVKTHQPIANGSPLLHPMALAIDNSDNYIITDQGDEGLSQPAGPGSIPAALWRFTPIGEHGFAHSPVPDLKAIHQGPPLFTPTGVAVETSDAYVVVDAGPDVPPANPPVSGIYRFTPPGFPPTTVINQATVPGFPAVYPVDMVRISDGHFVVLDRGARLPNPAAPQIIVVQEGPPLTVNVHPLNNISEPTSIALDNNGNFIICDAGLGPPTAAEPTGTLLQANVYLVDISTAPVTETPLLGASSLIYPSAVVLEDVHNILVTDIGTKPRGRYARLAEPASIYRIPLTPLPSRADLVSRDMNYVWPSDIEINNHGEIIMLDHGDSQDQAPARSWRTLANEFGVIIYFSEARPVSLGDKRKIIGSISRIVNKEKPAHCYWTLKNNQL